MDRGLIKYCMLAFAFAPSWVERSPVVSGHEVIRITDEGMNPARAAFEDLNLTQNQIKEIRVQGSLADLRQENLSKEIIHLEPMAFARTELNDGNWIDDLPKGLRRRLELAQEKNQTLDQDWSVPKLENQLVELEPQIFSKLDGASSGKIRLIEGAILGDRVLEVYHESMGQRLNEASVDLQKGVFAFQGLDAEQGGTIKGEIKDHEGVVVAEAELPIQGWSRESLVFRPKNQIAYNTVRIDSEKNPSKSSLETKNLQFSQLSGGSFSDITRTHPKSWTISRLNFLKEGEVLQLDPMQGERNVLRISPALKKKWEKQLGVSFSSDSVTVGRIVHDGSPLAQASVEMEQLARVVYLNEEADIDLNLEKTSDAGLFLVIGLQSGLHDLIARRRETIVGHVLVVANKGQITSTQIVSSTQKSKTELLVHDAFTGQLVPANLDLGIWGVTGTDPVSVTGSREAMFPRGSNLSFATVSTISPDYLVSSQLVEEGKPKNNFPVISRQWVQKFFEQNRLPFDLAQKWVVGFVPFSDYSVHDPQALYFDSAGRQIPIGQKGGGFLIKATDGQIFSEIQLPSGRFYTKPIPHGRSNLSTLVFDF